MATRSRGVLPPQEVFKNIVFDDGKKDYLRNSSPNRQQSQLPNELISPQYTATQAQAQQNSIKLFKSQSMNFPQVPPQAPGEKQGFPMSANQQMSADYRFESTLRQSQP